MSTLTTTPPAVDGYSLGRTASEHDRLRAQARVWDGATRHLFDLVGIPAGARCLDAGCGPGETMRVLAERAGPTGSVLGIDVDAPLLAVTEEALHAAGHGQCRVLVHDVTTPDPLPGGPFDVVYARLLLFHLPRRVEVLGRLWDAVAPGGVLVIQEYDLRACSTLPPVLSTEELLRIITGAFDAAGADYAIGARLPRLFAAAQIGAPDGTDVAGRLEPLATGSRIIASTARSVLPVAVANGITTEETAAAWLDALDRDSRSRADHELLWPLLMGAWKRRS
jgi:ubiquinone/menaquinone biosynthesis C-methylase UbiE